MKLQLAVVMRKELIDNPWQSHRWVLDEVVFDVGQFSHKSPDFTVANRPAICMRQDQKTYEEGWERIFRKKPKRNVYDEIVEGFESMRTQGHKDECSD